MLALLTRLEIESPVVAGLSLGGYVIFAMLRIVPAPVFRGIVLADTRPQADSQEGRAGRRRMIELVGREGAAGVAREMLTKLIADETLEKQPAVAELVRNMILSAPPRAITAALHRLIARPDSTTELARIACPTLVVVGERDTLTPPEVGREMHERIADSRLQVISGAGHLSNLERPDSFNSACTAFLNTV
jgi:pimeloyl-ACP methyl ester carboxylesterase